MEYRWHCNYITEDIADDLATIVKDYFEEAILNSLGVTPKAIIQSLRETPSKTLGKIAA
ncbi:protein of unknown function [Methylotuvimicrobium alcaliphilum 20Z]|uniref:Uncharacterized protein n=1 Tax=Methylotuvimicrobium alcaliphilum (strain DSM 19304 / NCIMB 14124 / VKM B-2133 / 20Z) TaxID=1091494 RepID=G4T1E6_META2|nr:protein of unknown function [Methylotuvimicrobium alcaliphilum 20Z]